MASSYSSSLRLELMSSGENEGSWGNKLNTTLQLMEAALSGRTTATHDDAASYTLTASNALDDEARNMAIVIGGTLTAARNVVVPTAEKVGLFKNATTGGFDVTVKTSAGTGLAVPNGFTAFLACDGTNVISAFDYFPSAMRFAENITLVSTKAIVSSGTDGYLIFGGGSAVTLGAAVVAFGESHATNANTLELRITNTAILTLSSTKAAVTGSVTATTGFASSSNATNGFQLKELGSSAEGVKVMNFAANATYVTITTTGINDTNIGATTRAAGSFNALTVDTGTPASASATGSAGRISWDGSYIYVCTATDTWKRAAIATW